LQRNQIKLFRYGKRPVLRGTALIRSGRNAYLWSVGFTPRLDTYPGREVPNPLTVDIVKGDADIETVLSDLMALTKLNFNSAVFSDDCRLPFDLPILWARSLQPARPRQSPHCRLSSTSERTGFHRQPSLSVT
jgi:hypothetical protein